MGFISERSSISQAHEIPLAIRLFFIHCLFYTINLQPKVYSKITYILTIKNASSLTTVEFMDYKTLVPEL